MLAWVSQGSHAALCYWLHWCGQRLLQWRLDDD